MSCSTYKPKVQPYSLPLALPVGCPSVELTKGPVTSRWRCDGQARITTDGTYYGPWHDPTGAQRDQPWLDPEMIDWDFVREHEAKHGKKFGEMRMGSDGVLVVDLWYPNVDDDEPQKVSARTIDHPVAVEVGLQHVRAADLIRIEYDFERDGYVIKQASKFAFREGEPHDPDWQEVAFVQAWGREVEDPQG